MKILYLITQDLESPYGGGRCWPLARELVRFGHKVRIIALHSDFNSLDTHRQTLDGVEVHYVAQMHVMKSGNLKSYYHPLQLILIVLRATLALSWAALNHPSDMIYVGKPHPMNSIAGLLAKIFQRIPMIVDCDDYEVESGRFSGNWQKTFVRLFEKNIPRYSNMVTTNTNFMRENLISWGVSKDKIVYIPNGIDPERFTIPDLAVIESERKRLSLENKKVIAYIGSLSLPSHPVDILIKAFSTLCQEIPDTVLMIVGGGEELHNLKILATKLGLKQSTRFLGRVPPKDIPLFYALADVSTDPIYDNPAARGRSPLKLLESWICGVPFVSADVGDRAMLIGSPPAGVLVTPDEKDALAEGIANVLTNDEFREALISRGKVRCKDYYWSTLVQILEDQFTTVINFQ